MSLIILWVVVFLVTVTLHELCHGVVAYLLGDPTAKQSGRVTLNPLRHIDPLWTGLFPTLLFFSTGGRFVIGMAKPVPVNFSLLKPLRLGMILVALAGPLANLLLAVGFAEIWHLTGHVLFVYAVYFNLGLAFFNLIPIPPLDGSRIIMGILPRQLALYYLRLESYGFVVILLLYFTGHLFGMILPAINLFCNFLSIPGLHLGD